MATATVGATTITTEAAALLDPIMGTAGRIASFRKVYGLADNFASDTTNS